LRQSLLLAQGVEFLIIIGALLHHTVEALICAQNWLRSSPLSVDIEEHLEDLEKLEEDI
jgi:hypothetical protein